MNYPEPDHSHGAGCGISYQGSENLNQRGQSGRSRLNYGNGIRTGSSFFQVLELRQVIILFTQKAWPLTGVL
jgi:hypothetical protein